MPAVLKRFFRTPKGLFLVVLVLLVALATPHEDFARVVPGLFGAVAVAVLIDVPILRWREGAWIFPDGAICSALLVAMILSPMQPWYVATISSAAAVLSKYLFCIRTANVFNPAALALVATFYPFGTAQSWWGALSEIGPVGLVAVFATGLFIAARVNKLPLMVAFLGAYFLLFTMTAFIGDPGHVAEIFREPDVNAALFFAFFMLSDPPTSPAKQQDQIVYAVIVAVASYAVFEIVGGAYFLLAGVLFANAWEAWRRVSARNPRRRRSALTAA